MERDNALYDMAQGSSDEEIEPVVGDAVLHLCRMYPSNPAIRIMRVSQNLSNPSRVLRPEAAHLSPIMDDTSTLEKARIQRLQLPWYLSLPALNVSCRASESRLSDDASRACSQKTGSSY